ncbi:efflux RND transporter periplasmic adaptor subunit [Hyalangium rubrum]|uniref:HlyD family efflux transporter periplasmic adaptor subunit n=1 Tax=Hyalangium rubrum TaxID=3103134 RepID=A0ABU5H3R0_9BACT|nr:HlyD family efflux transporter periplasmic adaptor subunit [Hyalangium sp. s54d21]MDY7228092.1 HlyD family efflux transporter periplasmic adaptor subunit [Hyalangium sp. s54d21]
MDAPRTKIFREEALRHHEGAQQDGDVLRISPAWTRWTYWTLLALLVSALTYSLVGTLPEYASGPAVVKVEGQSHLTVDLPGVVSTVAVKPGQRVEVGEVLVSFRSQEETVSLERIQREFELQLIRVLRDPADEAARQTLTSLRAERELAEARQQARTLRSPHAGVVSGLRIRPGQYVTPGENVISIVGDDVKVSLVALLPGGQRPLLEPGGSLRVELDGFRHEYHTLTIESVGDQIVGPAEVRRFLGPEIADAVQLAGPMVLVKARVPSSTFMSKGRTFNYFDGMLAKADARVRLERILVALVPGLKGALGHENR